MTTGAARPWRARRGGRRKTGGGIADVAGEKAWMPVEPASSPGAREAFLHGETLGETERGAIEEFLRRNPDLEPLAEVIELPEDGIPGGTRRYLRRRA